MSACEVPCVVKVFVFDDTVRAKLAFATAGWSSGASVLSRSVGVVCCEATARFLCGVLLCDGAGLVVGGVRVGGGG